MRSRPAWPGWPGPGGVGIVAAVTQGGRSWAGAYGEASAGMTASALARNPKVRLPELVERARLFGELRDLSSTSPTLDHVARVQDGATRLSVPMTGRDLDSTKAKDVEAVFA